MLGPPAFVRGADAVGIGSLPPADGLSVSVAMSLTIEAIAFVLPRPLIARVARRRVAGGPVRTVVAQSVVHRAYSEVGSGASSMTSSMSSAR